MAVVIDDLSVNKEIGHAKIFSLEIKQRHEECMAIVVMLLFADCVKV